MYNEIADFAKDEGRPTPFPLPISFVIPEDGNVRHENGEGSCTTEAIRVGLKPDVRCGGSQVSQEDVMIGKIKFNGTEYGSPEEMPPDVRAAYDKALELAKQGKLGGLPGSHVNVKFSTKVRFSYNGKVYESPEEMPPDVRERYDKAMEQVDKNHNGVPDVLESNTAMPGSRLAPTAPDPFASTYQSTLQPLAPTQPVITPERSINRVFLALAGILILALLAGTIALLMIVIQH